MQIRPGTVISRRFRIVRKIGYGGMSNVYEVEDLTEEPPVRRAMKVIDKQDLAANAALSSFTEFVQNEYEVQCALAEAGVKGVLRAYWFGRDREKDCAYLVMDLLPQARPLRLREGALEERLRRVVRAARVVAEAHQKGIIHRDIKPENLLEDGHGRVHLIDYGLACDLNQPQRNRAEKAGGTAPYAAPEQLDPRRPIVDKRADVFSLGVLLCEALGKCRPSEPVRPPTADDPKSRALAELAGLAVDVDPTRRPQDAKTFADRLERLLSDALPEDPDTYRLYITDDLFIRVDGHGNYLGEFHEGALGVVIQIETDRGREPGTGGGIDHGKFALKLPRLLADTHRENAYICKLLELEASVIRDMGSDGHPTAPGLLFSGHPVNTLKQTLHMTRNQHPYDEQRGQYLFVQFQKGGAPRFCGVSFEGPDGPRAIPPHKGFGALVAWGADVRECQVPLEGDEWRTVAIVDNQGGDALGGAQGTVFSLDDALGDDQCTRTWYTVLPSVIYRWAHGTLQEAIGRGELQTVSDPDQPKHEVRPWDPLRHLRLVSGLLSGVDLLHMRGLLHADLRPANVMYQSSPHEPAHFGLIDFGSLSTDERVSTALGAAVAGGRRSPFYGPERSGAIEHESADTAVFVQGKEDKSRVRIVLGWRRDLIRDGKPVDLAEVLALPLNGGANEVLPGDRVQIREYVFEVDRVGRWTNSLVVECPALPWEILQGRIVMKVNQAEWQLPVWLPISRVLVLQQWSAATDVFSTGAILLYSLFRAGAASELSEAKTKDIDVKFGEMIAYLASAPFLDQVGATVQQVRDDLRWLCSRADIAEANAPTTKIMRGGTEMDYLDWAYKVASILVHTAPGSEFILAALKGNVAYFVLVMHFALRCLHRGQEPLDHAHQEDRAVSSTLGDPIAPAAPGTTPSANQSRGIVPFCPSRRTRPDELVPDRDCDPDPRSTVPGPLLDPRQDRKRAARLALDSLKGLIDNEFLSRKLDRFIRSIQMGNVVAELPTYQLFSLGESCIKLRDFYRTDVVGEFGRLQEACVAWAAAAEARRLPEDSSTHRALVQEILSQLPDRFSRMTRDFEALGKLVVQTAGTPDGKGTGVEASDGVSAPSAEPTAKAE